MYACALALAGLVNAYFAFKESKFYEKFIILIKEWNDFVDELISITPFRLGIRKLYDINAMSKLSDEEILWYISTKEPMDKAGAYAIQGIGARFVKKIDGDFYTVMGLPCQRLYEKLKNFILKGVML